MAAKSPEIQVETHHGFAELAGDWEELADRVGATPWVRPGWISAWWSAFGRGTIEVVAVRHGGRLVALIPLRRRFRALGSMTNWHTPEFEQLADGGGEQRLTAAVLEGRPRQVSLSFLDVNRPTAAAWQSAAAARGYRVLVRTIERSPYVDVDGDWERYESGLDKKLVAELTRRRRRLAEEGKVSVEVETGAERLEELLEEGWRVEASGWKGARGSAIASQEATRTFYKEVARWAQARGWLRLAFLRIDSRALAFDFAIEHDGIHYLLKTGYDPSHRRLGPGAYLRYAMLARAFEHGLDRYEFLGSDEPWKLQWTRTVRNRIAMQAFAPSPTGFVDWSAHVYGRPVAKRVLAPFGG